MAALAERQGTVQYLPGGTISMIEEGAISVTRHAQGWVSDRIYSCGTGDSTAEACVESAVA